MTGLDRRPVRGSDFPSLLLLIRLSGRQAHDRWQLLAVRGYYALLGVLRFALRWPAPGIASWADRERRACSYFAAVALDHRLARAATASVA